MAGNNARVILHIDLDCFYCQVEQKRLNIPRETPCAVQQWEGLIAVNYAARAAGITRHMRVHEARQKCPDLRTVHVQTLGGDGSEEAANDAGNVVTDRSQQKACLERYRKACSEILAVFHDVAPQVVIEKASIDEVYMDVTTLVDEELQESGAGRQEGDQGHAGGDALQVFSWGSVVVGCPLDVDSEFDRRLAVGAKIACRLRGAIRDRLGFTCSAGIACNKLLAKIASAMHKPNQQTLVPPRAVPGLMQDLPLKKIRNFGGKLGAELDAMGCRTAGDVIALPHQQLRQRFGEEKAGWIAGAVRGESNEPVQVKEKPKSMLAAKSFEPTSDLAILTRWLRILADELANRMIDDEAQHQRRPRNLCLHYRSGSVERSKSTQMPRFGKAGPTTEVLTDAAVSLFRKCADALPCARVALSATDFIPTPSSSDQGAITRFFAAVPAGQAAPPAGPPAGEPCEASGQQEGPHGHQPGHGQGNQQANSAARQRATHAGQPGAGRASAPRNPIAAMFRKAAASSDAKPLDAAVAEGSHAGLDCGSANAQASAQQHHHEPQQPQVESNTAAALSHAGPPQQQQQQPIDELKWRTAGSGAQSSGNACSTPDQHSEAPQAGLADAPQEDGKPMSSFCEGREQHHPGQDTTENAPKHVPRSLVDGVTADSPMADDASASCPSGAQRVARPDKHPRGDLPEAIHAAPQHAALAAPGSNHPGREAEQGAAPPAEQQRPDLAGSDAALACVNLEEQKRILQDIRVQLAFEARVCPAGCASAQHHGPQGSGQGLAKRGAGVGSVGQAKKQKGSEAANGKQLRISAMFSKPG